MAALNPAPSAALMQKINLDQIPESGWKSPKGTYHQFSRKVSVALGREPASLNLEKPWDVSAVALN
ncbi:MAG: hypothetical protein ACR2OZ_09905 [Verrucomicrobiales bacterium]